MVGLTSRRKTPVNENIVMLKRLSEAISQSNIQSKTPASETHGAHHSSCNFNPNPIDKGSGRNTVSALSSVNCVTGGQEPSRAKSGTLPASSPTSVAA